MAPDAGEDDGQRGDCTRIVAAGGKLYGGKNHREGDCAAQEDVSHACIEWDFLFVGLGEPHEREAKEGDKGGGDQAGDHDLLFLPPM